MRYGRGSLELEGTLPCLVSRGAIGGIQEAAGLVFPAFLTHLSAVLRAAISRVTPTFLAPIPRAGQIPTNPIPFFLVDAFSPISMEYGTGRSVIFRRVSSFAVGAHEVLDSTGAQVLRGLLAGNLGIGGRTSNLLRTTAHSR